MKTQVCSCCNIEKSLENFYFRKDTNSYRRECIECRKLKDKEKYMKNKNKLNESSKEYYQNNKKQIVKRKKQYYIDNKEYFAEKNKQYREKHREKLNEYAKHYRQKNQNKITAKRKEKRHNDKKYYYEIYFRNKINNYLNRYGKINKKNNIQEILGCNYEEFKKHIEDKFQDGMSWENRKDWHLDHIIPLSTAKNYEDLVRLNHYTNFQPLWAVDNLRKGAKL